jgi:hypothetical protein
MLLTTDNYLKTLKRKEVSPYDAAAGLLEYYNEAVREYNMSKGGTRFHTLNRLHPIQLAMLINAYYPVSRDGKGNIYLRVGHKHIYVNDKIELWKIIEQFEYVMTPQRVGQIRQQFVYSTFNVQVSELTT